MTEYQFSVFVDHAPMSHDEILDATDSLGDAGCTDASIRGHREGLELLFARSFDSLQGAIATAVKDVEAAGFRVSRVEMERQAIPA